MWVPPPGQGFPLLPGREEELKKLENGDVGGGRTGVSFYEPLRTPTQSPPKNITKRKNTQKNSKIYKPNKKKKTTVIVKETSFNILSTNANGLKYKAEDLKNKIKYFDSAIFAIQETHFTRKGKFKLQNFNIFESIRKNKEQGGSMLGIHMGLQPVLIKEYNTDFELLVVQIKAADKVIIVMTGYGPQEHWKDHERLPFFTALEEEIASAEYEGKPVIVLMDANSKLGTNHIQGDPHDISKNGKVLEGIIERHGLCVVNGLVPKRKGIITRQKHTVNRMEQGVIDFVLISSELIKHIEYIHVDDERVHVLTKNVKTQNGICSTESDHNIINTKFNISWSARESKVMEIFKYKDKEALQKFKDMTTNTDKLSKIIDTDKPLDIVTKKFLKRIKGFIHQCFKKVRLIEKEDQRLEELYNIRRLLRTKSDDASIVKLDEVEKELCEKYSEVMCDKIMGELKDMGDSEDGGYNSSKLWKLKNKLSPRFTDPPTAMMNSEGKLLTDNKDIIEEAVKHYKNVFKSKEIKEGLEDVKVSKENRCHERLNKASNCKPLHGQ